MDIYIYIFDIDTLYHLYIYIDYPLCSSTTFNNKNFMIFLPQKGGSPNTKRNPQELMLKAVGRHGQAFPGRKQGVGFARRFFCGWSFEQNPRKL